MLTLTSYCQHMLIEHQFSLLSPQPKNIGLVNSVFQKHRNRSTLLTKYTEMMKNHIQFDPNFYTPLLTTGELFYKPILLYLARFYFWSEDNGYLCGYR